MQRTSARDFGSQKQIFAQLVPFYFSQCQGFRQALCARSGDSFPS